MPDGSEQQITRLAEPDSFAVQLGQRLRAARAVAGLSLAQVQKQSGGRWTGGAVGTYERGSRNITAETLVALAGFYGIDPVALIPGATQSRGEGRPALGERGMGAGPSPAMTPGPPAGEEAACSPGGPRGGSQPTPWEPPRQPGHGPPRHRRPGRAGPPGEGRRGGAGPARGESGRGMTDDLALDFYEEDDERCCRIDGLIVYVCCCDDGCECACPGCPCEG